jgi:calmodulin
MPASKRQILSAFRQLDTDKSGKLSKEEFHKVFCESGDNKISDEKFAKVRAVADKNGDGQIDYEEFAIWLSQMTKAKAGAGGKRK